MNDPETLEQAAGQAAYRVTRLRDAAGHVAPHYLHPRLVPDDAAFERLMEDAHFAEIIEQELAAERAADGPLSALAEQLPTNEARDAFLRWLAFMNADLDPWTTGGAIHFRPHWARVLAHVLCLGAAEALAAPEQEALCHAAVFHDSRRADPYLDTGHGARAAEHYRAFCLAGAQGQARNSAAGRAMAFDGRAYLAIAWHDRDDEAGLAAIRRSYELGALVAPAPGDADPATCGAPLAAAELAGTAQQAQLLYRLFKDADALDRVRLGVRELDTRYFRTRHALGQLPFARDLFAATPTALE